MGTYASSVQCPAPKTYFHISSRFVCQDDQPASTVPTGQTNPSKKFAQTPVNQSAGLIGLGTSPRSGEGGPARGVLPARDSGRQPRPGLREEGQGDGQADSGSEGPATRKTGPALCDLGHLSKPPDRRNEPAQTRREVLDESAGAFVVPTRPTLLLPTAHHRPQEGWTGPLETKEAHLPPPHFLDSHEWVCQGVKHGEVPWQAACGTVTTNLSHTVAAWVEKHLRDQTVCSFTAHSAKGRQKGGGRNTDTERSRKLKKEKQDRKIPHYISFTHNRLQKTFINTISIHPPDNSPTLAS